MNFKTLLFVCAASMTGMCSSLALAETEDVPLPGDFQAAPAPSTHTGSATSGATVHHRAAATGHQASAGKHHSSRKHHATKRHHAGKKVAAKAVKHVKGKKAKPAGHAVKPRKSLSAKKASHKKAHAAAKKHHVKHKVHKKK